MCLEIGRVGVQSDNDTVSRASEDYHALMEAEASGVPSDTFRPHGVKPVRCWVNRVTRTTESVQFEADLQQVGGNLRVPVTEAGQTGRRPLHSDALFIPASHQGMMAGSIPPPPQLQLKRTETGSFVRQRLVKVVDISLGRRRFLERGSEAGSSSECVPPRRVVAFPSPPFHPE